jgi:hypothetical protein
LFFRDVVILEKLLKIKYEKEINPNGHEIIDGVLVKDIIHFCKTIMDTLSCDYRIIPDNKLQLYNDYVDTTIKK